MRLLHQELGVAPSQPDFFRIDIEIALERDGERLHYWFDLPAGYEAFVSPSGNAAAALMLPIACVLGEPIHLERPVDPLLVDRLRGVQRAWQKWYPELHEVEIEAPPLAAAGPEPAGERVVGSFFSGGVDSLFTLVRHADAVTGDGTAPIADLICIGGFNTPVDDRDAMRRSLQPIAAAFGKRLVPISTNLRYSDNRLETPYSIAWRMSGMSHGCALGVVGHLLDGRYREILIPATHDTGRLVPWGSHPLTDSLLSSRRLAVVHEGVAFSRVEKTRTIAGCAAALDVVHVCWQARELGNCSRCQKCLRTMATLDLLGLAGRVPQFDWTGYGMPALARTYLYTDNDAEFFAEVMEAAAAAGRRDVTDAIARSLRVSARRRTARALMHSNALSRGVWEAARRFRRARLAATAELSPGNRAPRRRSSQA